MTRAQLLALGFSSDGIQHRLATGRLHRVRSGVYAVGRPELGRHAAWMAAVLSCGPHAVLSHRSAAALWGIAGEGPRIEVSVPATTKPRRGDLTIHRRAVVDGMRRHGIPVTSVVQTLIDLATCPADDDDVEAAVNEADARRLVRVDTLRAALAREGRRPGAGRLKKLLDRRTFVLTDSGLERRFLPIARRAGLTKPRTGVWLNGFKVDFYWPELGLVVETDSLTYHRTPAQQARDRLRDQAHLAMGLTPVRFTHAQIAFEPGHVGDTLRAVTARLRR